MEDMMESFGLQMYTTLTFLTFLDDYDGFIILIERGG